MKWGVRRTKEQLAHDRSSIQARMNSQLRTPDVYKRQPGDTWQDYIPVFVANGFYKNRSEFTREHIVYSRFSKFPKVDRYLNTGRLIRLRNKILVNMDFKRQTVSHHEDIYVKYNIEMYKEDVYKRQLLYIRKKSGQKLSGP